MRVDPRTGSYLLSDLKPAGDGTVIALWVCISGDFYSDKYLYTQKYSAAGTPLWGRTPVVVYDGGTVQFGYFPTFLPDGAGGAVYGWYVVSEPRNCYVQMVDASGHEKFAHNGLPVSTATEWTRLEPAIAFNPATVETFIFWTETDYYQTVWGLYGQRFSASGDRLWSDTGRELLPLTDYQNGFIQAVISGPGAMVFYLDDPGPGHVMAMRLDAAGDQVWPDSPRMACSVPSSKWDLEAALAPSGTALLAWTDQRVDPGNIYAQNVNANGALGPQVLCPGDMNCDGRVTFADIDPFVEALAGESAWNQHHPDCPWLNADCNGDGHVTFADIDPFVAVIGTTCP